IDALLDRYLISSVVTGLECAWSITRAVFRIEREAGRALYTSRRLRQLGITLCAAEELCALAFVTGRADELLHLHRSAIRWRRRLECHPDDRCLSRTDRYVTRRLIQFVPLWCLRLRQGILADRHVTEA